MKTYKSLVAVAIATALGSSSAYAVAPGTAIQHWVFAGGGSAQANAAEWVGANLLNSVDLYTDGACGKQSGNYRIITGTAKAAMGPNIKAGDTVGFMYKYSGGTWPNGGVPFLASAGTPAGSLPTLSYPNTTLWSNASNFTSCGITFGTASQGLPTYSLNSGFTFASQIPAFGLTDEEPALLNVLYNQASTFTPDSPVDGGGTWTYGAPATAAQFANIQTDAIYANLFGFAVTNVVYQGTTAFPHPKTSFSKAEIAAILGGLWTNWNQLKADDGTQMPNLPIILLDRGSGSGTKAGGSQYFLGYPGSAGGIPPGSQTYGYNYYLPNPGCTSGSTYTPITVGSMPACAFTAGSYLDVAEGSNGNVIADLKTAQANNAYAVAILGGEFPPALNQPSAGVNAYSFAKINGVGIDTGTAGDNINVVPPTSGATCANAGTKYTNVINGSYDYYYQNAFTTNAATTAAVTASGGADFAAAAKTALQTNGVSAAANTGALFPNAVPGLLLDPSKVVVSTQIPGLVSFTRYGNSTAPVQAVFDATNGLAPSSYGCDIL